METAYCYDQDAWENTIARDYGIGSPEKPVTRHDGALVLPLKVIPGTSAIWGDGLFQGGVCDADGNLIAGQFRSIDEQDTNRSCVRGYKPVSDDIEYRDEEVIFGGILVSHWGHMLVDATSRLWYLVSPDSGNRKAVFVMFPGQEFPYQELFDLAGISEDRYEIITRPTKFRTVIVPAEASHSTSANFTSRWMDFFDAASANVQPSEFEKVYLSRTRFKFQNVIGEQYFEDYFKNHGYHVVYPEQLSITEQISLMAGAKSVATTMGTISHLALFSKPGTEFIILNRSQDVVSIQLAIDQLRGINALYVDSYRNFLPEHQGGNCVFLLAPSGPWNRMIRERFGEDPDLDYFEGEFPRVALEYAKAWGEFFSHRAKYRWIRNFDTRDLVHSVNLALNDTDVDVSSYPEPVSIERLRDEAALSTTRYPTAARATAVEQRGTVLTVTGLLEARQDVREAPLGVSIGDSGIAPSGRTFCKWSEPLDDDGGLMWDMQIDLLDIPVSAGQVQLVVGSEADTEQYPIVIPHDVSVPAQRVLDANGCLAYLEPDGQQDLFLEKSSDYQPEDVLNLTWVDALEWKEDGLALSGHSAIVADPAEMPTVSLGVRSGDETAWIAPAAFAEDVDEESDAGELHWSSLVDKAKLTEALNGFARNPVEPIDMVFGFSRSGQRAVCPFGRKRKSGSIRHYRNDFIRLESGAFAYPVERNKGFGFSIGEGEKLIRHIRVERGLWKYDVAVLDGTVECCFGKYLGDAFPIVLQIGGETKRIGAAKIVSKEPGFFSWHAEIPASEIVAAFSGGTVQPASCPLMFVFQIGETAVNAAFGSSRKSGTIPSLKRKMPIGDTAYVEFAAKDAGNITLRVKEIEPESAEHSQNSSGKSGKREDRSVFHKIFRK